MAIPDPQLGLVISYGYLWHYEHRRGQEHGRKTRPCVIVLAIETPAEGAALVRVAPVTHTPPSNPATAIELPAAVKRHLGLDDARSWVVLDEVNEFTWPGYDVMPVPGRKRAWSYGLLPPRLFEEIMAQLQDVWLAGRGKNTLRD